MQTGTYLRFTASGFVPIAVDTEVALSVADSWLVEDGRVLRLEAHFARFAEQVRGFAAAPSGQTLDAFFAAVRERVPSEGRYFPRIEYHHGDADPLYLRLREAPETPAHPTLWTLDHPDPRTAPLVKGPDLSLGMQLRRRAQLHGADEAVLLNAEGYILEGALSSIVWWQDDRLCVPDSALPWLPGITRAEVIGVAQQSGLPVLEVRARPLELEGPEVWLLSSLQGIKRVGKWLHNDQEIQLAKPSAASAARQHAFELRLRLLSTRSMAD